MDEETRLTIMMRAKVELRKRLRALRNTAPASALAKRSEGIVKNLESLDAMKSAKSIALFWPIEERHEVDLRALDATLRSRGVQVAYPHIASSSAGALMVDDANVMTFRFAAPDDHITIMGFRAAPDHAPIATALDVIVVPALALDALGNRLGYGAGFYDRALVRFENALKIGVAYDFQLLVEVPITPGDVAMNVVVTDTRTINCGAES